MGKHVHLQKNSADLAMQVSLEYWSKVIVSMSQTANGINSGE